MSLLPNTVPLRLLAAATSDVSCRGAIGPSAPTWPYRLHDRLTSPASEPDQHNRRNPRRPDIEQRRPDRRDRMDSPTCGARDQAPDQDLPVFGGHQHRPADVVGVHATPLMPEDERGLAPQVAQRSGLDPAECGI